MYPCHISNLSMSLSLSFALVLVYIIRMKAKKKSVSVLVAQNSHHSFGIGQMFWVRWHTKISVHFINSLMQNEMENMYRLKIELENENEQFFKKNIYNWNNF